VEILVHSPSTLYISEGCYKLTRHKETRQLYWKYHYVYKENLPILDFSKRERLWDEGHPLGRAFEEGDLERL